VRGNLQFLGFGLRAWGGPVAQIASFKRELVDCDAPWMSKERFNRVLAVYQVLPGPEATELCCYFGMLAAGRPGAMCAGTAFILPGFCSILLLSWLYVAYNESLVAAPTFHASFVTVQAAVAALVLKAAHKIGTDAVKDHATGETSLPLLLIAGFSALQTVMNINFFITLLSAGVLAHLVADRTSRRGMALAAVLVAVFFAGYFWFLSQYGAPSGDAGTFGARALSPTYPTLFLIGLGAGLLTFGGAYTAIPLVQSCVAGWMSSHAFLDGLALCSVVPAPLVMFNTFVGYYSGGFLGAVLMTVAVFIPAFSFTLIGHDFFERAVNDERIHSFLDGVTGAVVGMVAITAAKLLKSTVTSPPLAVVYMVVLLVLYKVPHRYISIAVILAAAIAGQALV
jgi:chromate transporter